MLRGAAMANDTVILTTLNSAGVVGARLHAGRLPGELQDRREHQGAPGPGAKAAVGLGELQHPLDPKTP